MDMKRLIVLALIFVCCMPAVIAQDVYSRDAALVSKNGNVATLTSSGIHEKKKNAVEMAIKSAFNTLLFSGVDGLNDGKPLITNNNQKAVEPYLENLYNGGKYTLFLGSYSEKGEPVKLPTKQYKSTITVEIMYESLVKDLIDNGLMAKPLEKADMEEVAEEIAFPSIMVVPFKNTGESYREVLNDFDRRMAVDKVQDGFKQKDIETVDFIARLNAAERAGEYEADKVADSNDRQLLMNSGADVYTTVDIKKETTPAGMSRVALSLKAYETATGTTLASKQGWTPNYKTSQFDKLCVLAVKSLLPDFMKDISVSFAQKVSKGTSVALRVSIGADCTMGFSDQVDGRGSLSSLIRQWIRKNSQGGKYHLQGTTAEAIIFDKVQIPPKAADGFTMDAATFMDEFVNYLKDELQLDVESNSDGSTIYVTIH